MAAGQGLIKARRALSALYETGVEIRFGGRYGLEGKIHAQLDDQGNETKRIGAFEEPLEDGEVAMWIQPPSPLHREQALRNANAARSRAILAARQDEESAEHLEALEFVSEMSEDVLYDFLLNLSADTRRQDAIREILADEEWSDITELQESMRIFEEEETPEDDPEYVAVMARQMKLNQLVTAREMELREAELDVMRMKGPEAGRKKAAEHRSDLVGSQAFMLEYERQMIFHSVRDPEAHGVMFFGSAKEFAEVSDPVRNLITEALSEFISDGSEAKN